MYRIITDTSAYLELELLERKGIAEIPFSFSMPEKGGDALYCPDFPLLIPKHFMMQCAAEQESQPLK